MSESRQQTSSRTAPLAIHDGIPAPVVAWSRVNALVDKAGKDSDLVAHRVHLLAARRRREQGRPVGPELVELERRAAVKRLAAPVLLERVRRAYDGPALLLKGAEVAALYPEPELRPYADLDLLVPDARQVYDELRRCGFEHAPDPGTHGGHHLRPLAWPGLPMMLELHTRPSWPSWLTPPSPDELFHAASGECPLGFGVMSPSRSHHALVLAAHAWRDAPLARLGHLLDVYVMCLDEDAADLASLARTWKIDRLWRNTVTAIGDILGGDRASPAVRALTRPIESMRDRRVIETKVTEWIAPFWGLPARSALRATAGQINADLRPAPDEAWRGKGRRSWTALRHAFLSQTKHDEMLTEAELRRGEPPTLGS